MLTLLRPQHVAARDFIYHEGEAGFDMYFLVRGECASGFYLGNVLSEMKISIFIPGSFFGEGALIEMGKRKTSVMAQTDCYILALARSDIDWLISTYPHWARVLLTCLKQHMRNKKKVKSWKGLRDKLRGGKFTNAIKNKFKLKGKPNDPKSPYRVELPPIVKKSTNDPLGEGDADVLKDKLLPI